VQKKDVETDGYRALQVTVGTRRASRVTAAAAGHFKKAGVEAGRGLWELSLDEGESWPTVAGQAAAGDEPEVVEIQVGDQLRVSRFEAGQMVDVTVRSIGKGFAGAIKRHNFKAQRATHGNSKAHRAPGAIGQNQSPGHVFKGKKMAGHLGDARTTVQNLQIVRVDEERNLVLVRGGVPGAKGSDVIIQPAAKKA